MEHCCIDLGWLALKGMNIYQKWVKVFSKVSQTISYDEFIWCFHQFSPQFCPRIYLRLSWFFFSVCPLKQIFVKKYLYVDSELVKLMSTVLLLFYASCPLVGQAELKDPKRPWIIWGQFVALLLQKIFWYPFNCFMIQTTTTLRFLLYVLVLLYVLFWFF